MPTETRAVPFLDLQALHLSITPELKEALSRVVSHGQFINGPEVKAFEQKWARYCETAYAIGCANGTASLHAIFAVMGIGRGDEVVIPSHTFVATAESVRLAGATPVFADIDPETMLLSPKSVEGAIRSRTKAIVPVHLYGMPCDMDGLRAVAKSIPIIEDAAQAHGARYKGKRVGALSIAGSFSFFPGKNLGALGDAGGVTTNDATLARDLHRYMNHGRDSKFESAIMGTNYRIDTIQASVLMAKLAHLDAWNAQRAKLAALYRQRLAEEPFRSVPVKLQADTPGAESSWHLFVVRVPNRDKVIDGLRQRGVQTGIHYPVPVHLQPSMADISKVGEGLLVHTEKAANSIISLPMGPTMTEDDVEYVCEALAAALMWSKG